MEVEALVVGAGPAGLVTAAELARRGVACRVVDQLAAPRAGTRCPTVWQRTLEVLDLMGLPLAEYLRHGAPLERKVFHVAGEVAAIGLRDDSSAWPLPLLISQERTEELLGGHLGRLGVRVERPVRATALAQDGDGVTVALRRPGGGERVRAAWLVLAHGDVQGQGQRWPGDGDGPPGIQWRQRAFPGARWLQVDARLRGDPMLGGRDEHIFRDEGVHFGLVPLPGGAHRLFMTLPRPGLPADGEQGPGAAEITAAARAAIGPGVALGELGPAWSVLPQSRLASTFQAGRCLLVGEAAKRFPLPVHGMNSAIHDAFNLGWKLAAVIRGEARPELLDSYTAERRAAGRTLLDRAERVLGHGTASPVRVLRERLRRGIFDIRTEPAAEYRDSPLSADLGDSRGPRAGERLPALPAVAAGRTTNLFALLRGGSGWTLLLLERPRGARMAAGLGALDAVLSPHRGRVETRVAALLPTHGDRDGHPGDAGEPLLYLVRPDGHIGFRGTLAHLGALRAYLRATFA